MAVRVLFHRLAAHEYREARDWYAARSIAVSRRFCDAVDRCVHRITQSPAALATLDDRYRWARVRRFPYVLIVRTDGPESSMIVALAHTSRRPGYWRRRK